MILCFTVLLCLFTNLSHFTIILFCTLLMWFHIRIETYLKKVLLNLCIMSLVWRSIQHNNTTPLVRFLFFWNFTIGQTGSNMFCWISQNCEEIFRLNFLYGQVGHLTLFWNKQKRAGSSRQNLAPLAPRNWWLRRQAPHARLRPRRAFKEFLNYSIWHSCVRSLS